MEIEEVQLLSFDDITKEVTPKKEEKEEKKDEPTPKAEDGLISFDDVIKEENEESSEDSSEKKTQSSNPEVLKLTLKALYEKEGQEFDDNTFDGSVESYLDLQNSLIEKKSQALLENHIKTNLDPLQQRFIELVDAGVSTEDAGDLVKMLRDTASLKKEDISEDIEIAEKVMRQYLKLTTNFNDSKINKEIKLKKEAGILTDEATENFDELQETLTNYEAQLKQEAEEVQKQEIAKQKANAEKLKEFLEETTEIAGIPLSKPLKDKWLKEYQTVDLNGQKVNPIFATRAKDPDKFDALMRFYNAIGLFKYDTKKKDFIPDMSVLKNVSKKDVVQELAKAIDAESRKGISSAFDAPLGTDIESTVNKGFEALKKHLEKTNKK